MSITMSQLAALFVAASKKVDPEVNRSLRALTQVGVGLMKREIQNFHAVDTGTMLNSVSAENVGMSTTLIGPTVDYATFVANGTSRMAARPFHKTAAAKLLDQAKDFGFSAQGLGL